MFLFDSPQAGRGDSLYGDSVFHIRSSQSFNLLVFIKVILRYLLLDFDQGVVLRLKGDSSSSLSSREAGACGFMAGFSSKLLTLPFDVAKKKIQTVGCEAFVLQNTDGTRAKLSRVQLSMKGAFEALWREEGARAFFRGGLPAVLKSGPNSAITFLVYEECVKFFEKRQVHSKERNDSSQR